MTKAVVVTKSNVDIFVAVWVSLMLILLSLAVASVVVVSAVESICAPQAAEEES